MVSSGSRRWLRKLVPALVAVNIVAVLVGLLAPAVIKARNDANSAATT
jgi:hypothetical protein